MASFFSTVWAAFLWYIISGFHFEDLESKVSWNHQVLPSFLCQLTKKLCENACWQWIKCDFESQTKSKWRNASWETIGQSQRLHGIFWIFKKTNQGLWDSVQNVSFLNFLQKFLQWLQKTESEKFLEIRPKNNAEVVNVKHLKSVN